MYDTESNTVISCPALGTKNRETLPSWSPDGRGLYFICAPPKALGEDNSRTQYSLCRIAFDADNMTWGRADTLISARAINRSMTHPRVSPDGKYVLFCMTEYGYFTVFDKQSDLCFYEVATGRYWPLACNSESSESTHSWSRNSRWFVFASKRMDDMYTRPYFAYVDSTGGVHKPFVMPQRDPAKYLTFLQNYNLPELVDGWVEPSEQTIRDVVLKDPVQADFYKSDNPDGYTGETVKVVKK